MLESYYIGFQKVKSEGLTKYMQFEVIVHFYRKASSVNYSWIYVCRPLHSVVSDWLRRWWQQLSDVKCFSEGQLTTPLHFSRIYHRGGKNDLYVIVIFQYSILALVTLFLGILANRRSMEIMLRYRQCIVLDAECCSTSFTVPNKQNDYSCIFYFFQQQRLGSLLTYCVITLQYL